MADKESEKMKSCLICIFENPESDLFLFLSEKYPQVNSFDDSCDNIKKDENGQVILDYLIDSNEIEIVKSKGAGVGKTTYIIDNFTEKGLEYVGLPLGGEFKRKTIMRLLKELTIPSKKDMGLYINFSDTKQIRLFTHVIFSLLFQKYLILNEDIFCLASKFKIKIDIPYSFYDFEEKFPLLKKFKSFELDIAKLPAYKFKDNDKNFKNNSGLINSNIQLVCNYLNAYKNTLLSKTNIYFKEVETSRTEVAGNMIDAREFTEVECQSLIKEYYICDQKVSYHQINAFVNVLAFLFRKFTNDYGLSIEALLNPKNRQTIIDAFLKLTKHFTKGAYNTLLSEQEEADKAPNKGFDQNKINDKIIEKLEGAEEIIRFQQIDPPLVLIAEDGFQINIINTSPPGSKMYKEMTEIYNATASRDKKKLDDYTNMEHKEILTVIKEIFQVNEKEFEERIKKIGEYDFYLG